MQRRRRERQLLRGGLPAADAEPQAAAAGAEAAAPRVRGALTGEAAAGAAGGAIAALQVQAGAAVVRQLAAAAGAAASNNAGAAEIQTARAAAREVAATAVAQSAVEADAAAGAGVSAGAGTPVAFARPAVEADTGAMRGACAGAICAQRPVAAAHRVGDTAAAHEGIDGRGARRIGALALPRRQLLGGAAVVAAAATFKPGRQRWDALHPRAHWQPGAELRQVASCRRCWHRCGGGVCGIADGGPICAGRQVAAELVGCSIECLRHF